MKSLLSSENFFSLYSSDRAEGLLNILSSSAIFSKSAGLNRSSKISVNFLLGFLIPFSLGKSSSMTSSITP